MEGILIAVLLVLQWVLEQMLWDVIKEIAKGFWEMFQEYLNGPKF